MTIYINLPLDSTTSNSATFNPTRDQIIWRALRMIGAYASTDQPRPEQVEDALETLNMYLKAWQIEHHLWLKVFAELTLVQGQNSYQIGQTSPDTCVIQGTANVADRPTRIFDATRKGIEGYEVPMTQIGRVDYLNITNKTTQARPTQFYYDAQRVLGKIYVWPTPDATPTVLVLNMDRPIQDIITDTQTYDMPQEWMDSLTYGLALRLAPEYGININERNLLAAEYARLKEALLDYDREQASVFFQMGKY